MLFRSYEDFFNLDQKNPHTFEEELPSPEEALKKYETAMVQVKQIKNQLKDELAKILEGLK